jgi:hypothetical protein
MKLLTQRDVDILYDLYRYRTLSVDQLKNVHFREKPSYIYRKLSLLKQEGFVDSYRLIALKNNKRGGCYYVTEKAIDLLEEYELIDQKRRARDNKVQGPALPHIIEVNELYVQLTHYGWQFNPSREVKAKFGMNRSAVIKGSLVNRDGKEFVIYLLEENSREDMIEQIAREIQAHDLKHVFLFCKGKESYFGIKRRIERIIAGTINALPYPFVLRVLKSLNGEQSFQQLFSRYGETQPIQTKHPFTGFIIYHKGEQKYIVNYLLGDQVSKYFLKKYAYDRYEMDGRNVLLFAWQGQLPELQEEFKAYPHIEIVTVPLPEIK